MFRKLSVWMMVLAFGLVVSVGCSEESSPLEDAQDATENAAEETEDAVEEGADEAEEAGEETEDAVDDMMN